MKKLISILLVMISFSCIANDTIKKPNVIVTTNGNFKEIPKEFITDKIYTSIDGINYPVYKTHLRAHETVLDLVCRLLLEKKKKNKKQII